MNPSALQHVRRGLCSRREPFPTGHARHVHIQEHDGWRSARLIQRCSKRVFRAFEDIDTPLPTRTPENQFVQKIVGLVIVDKP